MKQLFQKEISNMSYAQLMRLHNVYIKRSQNAKDGWMKTFYYNVAKGYEKRAKDMEVGQCIAQKKSM